MYTIFSEDIILQYPLGLHNMYFEGENIKGLSKLERNFQNIIQLHLLFVHINTLCIKC